MSLSVFFLVLFAALLHASWNALVKIGEDRFQAMLLLTVPQGVAGLAIMFTQPLPGGATWVWLAASGIFHTGYKLFLASAYEKGDLSRVYPIARGAAPMMVAVFALSFLYEDISASGYFGIALIGVGIMLLARGVWTGGEAVSLVPLALGSAACTAGYSLVDGLGARVAASATLYTGWLFFIDMVLFSLVAAAWRGRAPFSASRRQWRIGTLAGLLSFVAYWIVVWAMTVAPIPLITALRETSVFFAMLIGIIWLGERADRTKVMAAILIVGGVILLRL